MIGGNAFITEPGMAVAVGSIVFVVVVFGGMGSLAGAFIASLIIGALQTFSVALDYSMLDVLAQIGINVRTRFGLARPAGPSRSPRRRRCCLTC